MDACRKDVATADRSVSCPTLLLSFGAFGRQSKVGCGTVFDDHRRSRPMSFRYPQPSNEDDFELFGLRFLRELWQCPALHQYGKRGERQDGIDLIDEGGGAPLRAVQCKHHEPDMTIPPREIEAEVGK